MSHAMVLLLLLMAGRVMAQTVGTCNGFINLDYPSLADPTFASGCTMDPAFPGGIPPGQHCTPNLVTQQCDCCLDAGQTITVSAQLGTGEIKFGDRMLLARLAFDPDCQPFIDPICLARPGGPRIEWVSDATITTTCPATTWATGIAPNTPIVSPGAIPLTPTPTLIIPENAGTPPGFCELTFDLHIVADPGDTIFELVRYEVAACNNGNLVSGGRQTAKVQVCAEQGPFIGYEIKDQGITAVTGGSMDVPALGIFGAAVPDPERLTARRVIAPALPADIFGPHLLGFSDFDLPLPNPKPMLQITAPGIGSFTGQMGGRSFVLINMVKDLVAQPPAQPLTSVWACYNFSKGTSVAISWTDQFGPNTGKLRGTNRVCFPASLLGSTPPPVTYLCARNDPAAPSLFPPFVFVGSFWLNDKEHVDSVDDYCVPATVTVQ